MTNAYNVLGKITVSEVVSALQRQVGAIGTPGIDLFGNARTIEDCVKAINEVARVAGVFANAIQKSD